MSLYVTFDAIFEEILYIIRNKSKKNNGNEDVYIKIMRYFHEYENC